MSRKATEKKKAHISTIAKKDPVIDTSDPKTLEFLESHLRILTREELKALVNYHKFERLISRTKNIDSLRQADEFAKEMREVVQRQIKLLMWGEEIDGTVIFNEFVQDDTRGYLKVSTRNHSRLVRPLKKDELAKAIRKKQKRQTEDILRGHSVLPVKRKRHA